MGRPKEDRLPETESYREIQKTLGANVLRQRTLLGMSQRSFADFCGMSQSYVAKLELGTCRASTVAACVIAEKLGIDPLALFVPPRRAVKTRAR